MISGFVEVVTQEKFVFSTSHKFQPTHYFHFLEMFCNSVLRQPSTENIPVCEITFNLNISSATNVSGKSLNWSNAN